MKLFLSREDEKFQVQETPANSTDPQSTSHRRHQGVQLETSDTVGQHNTTLIFIGNILLLFIRSISLITDQALNFTRTQVLVLNSEVEDVGAFVRQ